MSATDLQDLLADAERMEKDSPLLTRLHLLLPIGLIVGAAVLLYFTGDLVSMAGAAAVAIYLGKFVILSGAAESSLGVSTLQLAILVFCMDLLVAYFFAFNLHHVYRIPRFGPWIERLQTYCRYWLMKHPWMRKWAFTGVMLFVMFPLTGTGAPAGSILGRIVGLRPWVTLSAICIGAGLGCGLMAAFAERLAPTFEEMEGDWWFQAGGILILAILLLVIIWLGRALSRAAERHSEGQETST